MGRRVTFVTDEKSQSLNDTLPINKNDVVVERLPSPRLEAPGKLSVAFLLAKWLLLSLALTIGVLYLNKSFSGSKTLSLEDAKTSSQEQMAKSSPDMGHHTNLQFDFASPRKFAFIQEATRAKAWSKPKFRNHVQTKGIIRVRSMREPSDNKVSVELSLQASHPKLFKQDFFGVRQDRVTLKILTQNVLPEDLVLGASDITPCMSISATIWISPGTILDTLEIHSDTLEVAFDPDLNYWMTGSTDVIAYGSRFSIIGVDPPTKLFVNPRETIIDVDSNSIKGTFSLYDLLSIHTDSGMIDVKVNPEEAEEHAVKPAKLRITSASGLIHAQTSLKSVPSRDYQTELSSSDSSIDAVVLHGSRTYIRSLSGRISVDLHPYGHNDSRTDIETHTNSGLAHIRLHTSISHPKDPLKKLHSFHHGDSGSMSLHYPGQWQGKVKGTIASGSLKVDWSGLKIIKDVKGWISRSFEAVKGDGEGELRFTESSGSLTLRGDA